MKERWVVYILKCADGTLYTGVTNRLLARIAAHNAGKGAKYVRARLPARLAYAEPAASRGAALSREAQIKRLTRVGKIALIAAKKSRRRRGSHAGGRQK